MSLRRVRWSAALVALATFAGLAGCDRGPDAAESSDRDGRDREEVVFSFVVVGCNQVGWPASREGRLLVGTSTANEPQLVQTFRDVAALPRAPELFLFVGDLVRNETSGEVLAAQLQAWQRLWDDSPLANGTTRLLPIPGNHELLRAVQFSEEGWYEVPDPTAVEAWHGWIEARDGTPSAAAIGARESQRDLLSRSRASFSNSFDARTIDGASIRFVVLDTDSRSSLEPEDGCLQPPTAAVEFRGKSVEGTRGQMVPGWTPVQWLESALEQRDSAETVFVLGHKPIVWPESADPNTFDSNGVASLYNCGEHRLAAAMCEVLGRSPEVVAYLCAHRHRWSYAEIHGGVRQLIAGNGGSLLDTDAAKSFGFTLVEIRRNGEIAATSWERPAPTPIDLAEGVGPAKQAARVVLRAATAAQGNRRRAAAVVHRAQGGRSRSRHGRIGPVRSKPTPSQTPAKRRRGRDRGRTVAPARWNGRSERSGSRPSA